MVLRVYFSTFSGVLLNLVVFVLKLVGFWGNLVVLFLVLVGGCLEFSGLLRELSGFS